MSNATVAERPTRAAVFGPLVAVAKTRVVMLAENGQLARDDAEFLLRALIDLESDGVEFFGAAHPADSDFYALVADYLVARVGRVAVAAAVLAPNEAEAIARGVDAGHASGRDLDKVVLQLINHQGGRVTHKFLVHHRGDHVGVAVVDINAGERVTGVFMDDNSTIEVEAKRTVPLGHKIAIEQLEPEAPVLKYGIKIGTAPEGLTLGDYVHTHNLRSARW